MPNELERIRISGFKSIRDLDIELNALNVLIGANGSGKSNFIEVFRLLNSILEKRLQLYSGRIGANALLHFGSKETKEIQIEFKLGSNGYEASLMPSQDETLIFYDEIIYYSYEPLKQGKHLGRGHQETKLCSGDEFKELCATISKTLESWKIYHFHDTSRDSPMKKMQNIHDNVRLYPDARNIAPFLYLLHQKYPEHYELIRFTIQRVAPFFDDFVLRPSPLNEDNIRLEWRDVKSKNIFNVYALSDGTLRFICLATLLLQPTLPSVILIDEPELGLHPFAIHILAGLLQSASTKTQVIVSTQSVPLINQFEPQDIIIVDRKEGQSTFQRLEAEALADWTGDYGIGDLWEKNVIGGRPQREMV